MNTRTHRGPNRLNSHEATQPMPSAPQDNAPERESLTQTAARTANDLAMIVSRLAQLKERIDGVHSDGIKEGVPPSDSLSAHLYSQTLSVKDALGLLDDLEALIGG